MFLFILGLIFFVLLRQSDLPTGIDGYFYLKQIQFLVTGDLYYHDSSIAFLYPALLNFILRNPVLSMHIATATVLAGIAKATYRLVVLVKKDTPTKLTFFEKIITQVLIGLVFYHSFLFLELNLSYFKAAVATGFLLGGICSFVQNNRFRGVFWFVLAVFTHKSMLLLAPFCFFLWILSYKDLYWRWLIWGLVMTAVTIALALTIFPKSLLQLNYLFENRTLFEIKNENYFSNPSAVSFLMLGAFSSVFIFFHMWTQRKNRWIHLLSLAIVSLPVFLPNPLTPGSLAYTYLLISFPFLMVGLLLLFWSSNAFKWIGTAGLIILLYFSIQSQRPFSDWLNKNSLALVDVQNLERLPKGSLIYAPRGVDFYVNYRTALKARSDLLQSEVPSIYRVAYVKPYLEPAQTIVSEKLKGTAVTQLGPDYFVFLESQWQELVRSHQLRPLRINNLVKRPAYRGVYD